MCCRFDVGLMRADAGGMKRRSCEPVAIDKRSLLSVTFASLYSISVSLYHQTNGPPREAKEEQKAGMVAEREVGLVWCRSDDGIGVERIHEKDEAGGKCMFVHSIKEFYLSCALSLPLRYVPKG